VANHKSAKKRNRQNEKKQARNYALRSMVHTAERKFRAAIAEKNPSIVKETLQKTISIIMHARTKGILHFNTASRKVARLSRAAHRALAK
jgi:small subunit ribosomal protein S20